jgi:hypothetical protein
MINLHFICLLLVVHLLSCNDYNPFENMDNVDLKIRNSASSISVRDTFEIFSTESLTVYPTVFEKIDSFSVVSNGNRLKSFQYVTIVKPQAGDRRFYFSWNDTGNTSVTIKVYRSDGESFSRSYDCYCISPLFQDSITCEVGSACTLYTKSLHDQSIQYHWYFGDFFGKQIGYNSFKAGIALPVEFRSGSIQGKGSLWVTDTNGCSSPKSQFSYNFTDNHPPLLAAISGKVSENGDTIITGDSLFLFRMRVMDDGGIRNVTFNGSDYDDREIAAEGEIFTKIVTDMYRFTQDIPAIITVGATDNSGKYSSKRIVVVYNNDGPKTESIILRIVNPGPSPSPVVDSTIDVIYSLYNYSSDTVFVKAFRSGFLSSKPDTVLPHVSKKRLSWECPLSTGINQVEVIAYRTDTLASESIIINRTIKITDTIPPRIPYVLINGIDGERHLVQSSSAICSFLTVRGSNEIRSVTINGIPAAPSNYNHSLYIDTIQTLHTGTSVIIKVVDIQGISVDTTIFIRQNQLPEYTGSIQRHYIVGRRQLDTLLLSDNDGDSVSCTAIMDPQIATEFTLRKIARNMVVIDWEGTGTPQTGLYTAAITLWDGYQSVNVQKQFYITFSGTVTIQPYTLEHSSKDKIDTLKDGSIDMTSSTTPVRIDFSINNQLKELTPRDSIIVENADIVTFSTVPGQFSVTLSNKNVKFLDTITILVKGIDGAIDTAGRIPVVYQPRTPDYFPALTYWCGLDRGEEKDMTIRKENALDWWINRVSSLNQFYSYSDGKESLIYKNTTPNQLSSLYFGNRNVVLINFKDNLLGQGGSWPNSPFTAFFAAKIKDTIPASGGILWSSSDYDYIYFALGVSGNGKLSILKGTETCSTVVESDIKLDTSWHVIMFRSNGSDDSDSIAIQMGVSEAPGTTVTTSTDEISDNLMIGSANKHIGHHAWPGFIAETIFYQKKLNDDECREISKYLKVHYKIK